MTDNSGIKGPSGAGSGPGTYTPPIDPDAHHADSSSAQSADRDKSGYTGGGAQSDTVDPRFRFIKKTDLTREPWAAPAWAKSVKFINPNHLRSSSGDIEILLQRRISGDPTESLLQIRGIENPEDAMFIFYDHVRTPFDVVAFDREKRAYKICTAEKALESSELLSFIWIAAAKSYSGASNDDPIFDHDHPVDFDCAVRRIEYQLLNGNGLVTLEAILGHLWAYWVRRACDINSVSEKHFSVRASMDIEEALLLLTYRNHDKVLEILEEGARACFGRWLLNEKAKLLPIPDMEHFTEMQKITLLQQLVSAEMFYRYAACAQDNGVRRGMLLKARIRSGLVSSLGASISNTVANYASNLNGMIEEGIMNTPFTGSCAPVGIRVPSYGPTAASLMPLQGGLILVRALTPIV